MYKQSQFKLDLLHVILEKDGRLQAGKYTNIDICACRYNCLQSLDDRICFDDEKTLCQTTFSEFLIYQWLICSL